MVAIIDKIKAGAMEMEMEITMIVAMYRDGDRCGKGYTKSHTIWLPVKVNLIFALYFLQIVWY